MIAGKTSGGSNYYSFLYASLVNLPDCTLCDLVSATLYIRCGYTSGDAWIGAFECADPWDESMIYSTSVSYYTYEWDVEGVTSTGWKTLDITGIVRSHWMEGNPNNGIVLCPSSSNSCPNGEYATWYTRESANKPYIVINYTQATPTTKYYALITAVSNYPTPGPNSLECPVNDAQDFYNALLKYSNWNSSRMQTLYDSNATNTNIQAAILNIGSQMTSNDVFLFYFSGHGSNSTDLTPVDQSDGKDEYLCTYGSSSVSNWIRDDTATRRPLCQENADHQAEQAGIRPLRS
jgi:hypothetical protein